MEWSPRLYIADSHQTDQLKGLTVALHKSVKLANAICSELFLNVPSFSRQFVPAVKMLPGWNIKELSELKVAVVPAFREETEETRTTTLNELKVDIGIQKKVEDVELETIDLLGFVQEVSDFMRKRKLVEYEDARWKKTENDPLYSAEYLYSKHIFSSVLTLIYRVME